MRTITILVFASTLMGCPGPKGDQGPPGPQGPTGSSGTNGMNGMNGMSPDGGLTGVASNCTPAQSFCDGSRLWTCTRSGTDAIGGGDCSSQGTTNNPSICSTTNCPYYLVSGACCRPSKVTCDFNVTGPNSFSGMVFGTGSSAQGPQCSAPTVLPPCTTPTGTFQVTPYVPHAGTCPVAYDGMTVQFDRTKVTAGQTITMPMTGATVSYTAANDTTKSCSQWTGTVTWTSDVPSYRVSFSLTCSETGKTGISVSGTIQGDV